MPALRGCHGRLHLRQAIDSCIHADQVSLALTAGQSAVAADRRWCQCVLSLFDISTWTGSAHGECAALGAQLQRIEGRLEEVLAVLTHYDGEPNRELSYHRRLPGR